MPLMGTFSALLSKARVSKSGDSGPVIARSTPAIDTRKEQERRSVAKQISNPELPASRSHGRFIFKDVVEAASSPSSKSSVSRKSAESNILAGSASSKTSLGSRGNHRSGRLSGRDGVTGPRGRWRDAEPLGGRERIGLFVRNNPLLRTEGTVKLVMDERSYRSLPLSTSSPSPESFKEDVHEDFESERQLRRLEETTTSSLYSTTLHDQYADIDLADLSSTEPEVLFEILASFHSDVQRQNDEISFTIEQRRGVEEFLAYTSTLAILGSNAIENGGVDDFETVKRICDEVFHAADLALPVRRSGPMERGRGGEGGEGVGENEDEDEDEERTLRDIVRKGLYDMFQGASPPPSPQPSLSSRPYPQSPSLTNANPPSPPTITAQQQEIGFTPLEIPGICTALVAKCHRTGKGFAHADLLKAEREIVNHALAWKFLVEKFVIGREALSEDLMRRVHELLMDGIPPPVFNDNYDDSKKREESNDNKTWEEYAGLYRRVDVNAGFTTFAYPSSIAWKMSTLIADFNKTVRKPEEKGGVDPIALAASFHHRIINIHPFLDGNGRLARLFTNAVLLRWVGVVVPFAFSPLLGLEEEKNVYLAITARASLAQLQLVSDLDSDDDDDDEEYGSPKPWGELAMYLLTKSIAVIEGIWDVLGDEDVVGVVPGWEEVLLDMYSDVHFHEHEGGDCGEGEDEEEKEGDWDWESDFLNLYIDDGGVSESESVSDDEEFDSRKLVVGIEGEGRNTRVRDHITWPNPPPRKRHPHLGVLGSLALPDWCTEGAKGREGVCGNASVFAMFERKVAGLMAGNSKGLVVPGAKEIGAQLSDERVACRT